MMSTRMMGSLRSSSSFRSQLRPRFTPICSGTHTAATSRSTSAPTAAENPLLCPRFRDASPLQRVELVKLGRHLQSPQLDFDDLTDRLQGLTCAVQDTTIVARALAALEKPFARDARCGGDQAAVADDPSLPKLGIQEQLYGPDLEKKLFRDLMTMDNLPLLMSTSILDAVSFLRDDPYLKLTNSEPTDFRRHFSLVRECGKSQISSSIAAPQTLATVVAIDFEDFELKYNKEGLRIYTEGLAGLQVMSQKGVDLRFLKLVFEGFEGRDYENAAISLIDCENARFALLIASPYFILVELVKVDGRLHLLLDHGYSAVVENPSTNSDAPHRPGIAVLISLLMTHHPSFEIEGPSEDIKNKVRDKMHSLPKYDFDGFP